MRKFALTAFCIFSAACGLNPQYEAIVHLDNEDSSSSRLPWAAEPSEVAYGTYDPLEECQQALAASIEVQNEKYQKSETSVPPEPRKCEEYRGGGDWVYIPMLFL